MTEPTFNLPKSDVDVYPLSNGVLHVAQGKCSVFTQPANCKLLPTDTSSLSTHHLVISGSDDLTVRVPIATQEEADQLSKLLANLQAEGASHD